MASTPVEGDDLVLEVHLDAPPAKVWRALTEADLIMRWFCPRPWRTKEAVLDLRPGGRFFTRMEGPDGEAPEPGEGCVLLVETERRLVWTDALSEGFRPNPTAFMTADITLTPDDDGTLYRAEVRHKDLADREKHEAMGFHDGWMAAARQLDEVAQSV
ncbi:SRPBCC family protein [Roseitranquillus sediminis]|uniref:SRPBCC family protein n=1 Tax=Roseitranquillus sediminis TaxID=2809051 RepID=UPI001D0C8B47|nr:SRPBCC family protein [Roseitranquillus sediminis]MBM9594267.1 SRPBCC family protein [Roseitranquillus sediminis]